MYAVNNTVTLGYKRIANHPSLTIVLRTAPATLPYVLHSGEQCAAVLQD